MPVVLSPGEVRAVLGVVRHPVRRMALCTIYALGLRLGEGLSLETGDIDGERLMVWIRDAKGAKDRGVPLARPLLARLRRYWKTERPASPTKYLFVLPGGSAPLHETTRQKTFSAARSDARLEKHATIHTLRHSYATHLLESGISLRTIQQVLGQRKTMTLPAPEFLRRFLQHVPPQGFHRVRAFGLLHHEHRHTPGLASFNSTPRPDLNEKPIRIPHAIAGFVQLAF